MGNIRIFHGSEVRLQKSVRGSLFAITRLCQVMPNSDPDRFFYPHQTTMLDPFLVCSGFNHLFQEFFSPISTVPGCDWELTLIVLPH